MRHLLGNILRNIAQKIDPQPDSPQWSGWQAHTANGTWANVYVDQDLQRWHRLDDA